MERDIVANDEILNFVNEIKLSFKKDKYNIDSIKDIEKDYPDKIKKIEETSNKYIGELDLKILKTVFPDKKWEYLTKNLAYPYQPFNSIDDYQKTINNIKTEDFFKKLKN